MRTCLKWHILGASLDFPNLASLSQASAGLEQCTKTTQGRLCPKSRRGGSLTKGVDWPPDAEMTQFLRVGWERRINVSHEARFLNCSDEVDDGVSVKGASQMLETSFDEFVLQD